MPLAAGTRLGPYEVVAPLGAGGMGEVYRARDTRLDRTVAVKILPSRFAEHPEARKRFEREARAISALSHPHICALYDVGNQDGVEYLVMEFLEGETLAARLGRGPLTLDELVRWGTQIADALEKAHRQGVVHRDLKPGNVMLTKVGAKLLDFGLAKAAGAGTLGVDLSSSPTVSRPLTAAGTIVGTFQYMAPEQLEGAEADARSDIFSFGTLLYEMATGKQAFDGSSAASLIAAILRGEPRPLAELVPMAPPALDRVVRTCLKKDPDARFQSAHDVKLQLEWLREVLPGTAAGEDTARRPRAATMMLVGAGMVLAFLAGWLWTAMRGAAPEPRPAVFSLSASEGALFQAAVEEHNLAISPDGRTLAFVAITDDQPRIWLRRVDSPAPRPLAGTEGAGSIFWSPDGEWLGFFADRRLKKIRAAGGPAQTLCSISGIIGTASWGRDGTILFTEFQGTPERYGVLAVDAAGGEPFRVVAPSQAVEGHRWPHWLPDGRHFLYVAFAEELEIRLHRMGDAESRTLLRVASRVEYARGHLYYVRDRTLVAHRFDPWSRTLSGEAIPVAERLPYFLIGWAPFAVSEGGVIAYQAGETNSELLWFDRQGRSLGTLGEPGLYESLAISPDGQRAAVEVEHPDGLNSDLWIYDLARGVGRRFTSEPGYQSSPVWSPDGRQIAFGIHGHVMSNLMVRDVVGSGGSRSLVPPSGNFQFPSDWSRDGRSVAFSQFDEATGLDIWLAPLADGRAPFPFRQTAYNEGRARFSPDSRWLAYESDETGRMEIYLQPVDRSAEPVSISRTGGTDPRWQRDGRALFFFGPGGRFYAVSVRLGRAAQVGAPVEQFRFPREMGNKLGTTYGRYDVTMDGQRILVISGGGAAALPVTVHLDWQPGQRSPR